MAKAIERRFHAFYFLKNCKIDSEMELGGGIRLIPFEGFSLKSEFALIEKFSIKMGRDFGFEIGPELSKSAKEGDKKYMKKIKMVVLFIPIKATNEKSLKKTLDAFVENVMFILSAFKNTHVERVGYFALDVEGKHGNRKYITYYFDPGKIYKDYDSRSLLNDNQLSQILTKSLDIHKTIEKYGLIKHSKQLYYEYLSETNKEWGFLRLWNILEIQAEHRLSTGERIFTKKELKTIKKAIYASLEDKEIDPIKGKKVETILASLNLPPIKDKIRKMLEKYQIAFEQIDDSHDIIDHMYQYRNCLIHYGGCTKKRGLKVPCENWCKNSKNDTEKLTKELRNLVLQIIFPDFNIYLRPEKKQN